nr:hypothetical protein [Enterococcus italicus]
MTNEVWQSQLQVSADSAHLYESKVYCAILYMEDTPIHVSRKVGNYEYDGRDNEEDEERKSRRNSETQSAGI